MENKVQFNLKNVHYAVHGDSGSIGTPKPVPGAVSLTLNPAGEKSTFYADGVAYYVSDNNDGYAGSLELARFTDEMRQDIYGVTKNTDNVLVENANALRKPVALLFQIDGDADNEYYALYNVTLGRPGLTGRTNTESKEVQTQTADVTAAPLADGRVLARTTAETTKSVKDNWFKTVYMGGVSE